MIIDSPKIYPSIVLFNNQITISYSLQFKMKNFVVVIGILSLIAGYVNAAVVTTGQVLATRGGQMSDTSIFKSGGPRPVQERDYKALILGETKDKPAKT
jgi:hypothetical protein